MAQKPTYTTQAPGTYQEASYDESVHTSMWQKFVKSSTYGTLLIAVVVFVVVAVIAS